MKRFLIFHCGISAAILELTVRVHSLRLVGLGRLLGLLMIGSMTFQGLNAQTSGSGCYIGRWGIDAGLYSGVIEFGAGVEPIPPYSRDWFQGLQGGDGVIDESNTASIQTLLQTVPNPTYETRMKYDLVSIVDDQILVDGIFARDQFGGTGHTDPTSYLTASKNGEDPAIWDPGESNVLGKNDIIDVGGHMYRDGIGNNSELWFIGLFNMAEPGGVSYMDFEFFVEDVQLVPRPGGGIIFTSGGPQLGHTAYNFDTPGNITKIGDFIFSVALLASGPVVETRLWVSYADWIRLGGSTGGSTPTFQWAGTFDGAFNNAPFGYAGILPLGAGQVCGYVNQDGELPLAPPWGTKGTKTNEWRTTYIPYSIAEVGINLTALGMDHSSLSGADPCFFPLNTYIVKTRASASFTAQLKDFAGPYEWGQPRFDMVFDNTLISCENQIATISASPERTDVNYLWSTLDGNILNVQPYTPPLPQPFGNKLLVDPNNPSIILGVITGGDLWEISVDKVGSYELNIKLPNDCPVPSGIVSIGLDPNFPYFDGPPTYTYTVPCNTNDGTITVSASGATQPYTFFLYNGVGDLLNQVTVAVGQNTHTFTGLTAGDYRVDVKGVYACIETTGPIILPARIPVDITPTLTQVDCFGDETGAINLAVAGGNPPLSYLWSTGNTSQNLLNIGAGDYTVTITDADGCQTIQSFTITQPPMIEGIISKVDDPGNAGNGSASIVVSGGTAPYTYLWTKTGDPAFLFLPSNDVHEVVNLSYGHYSVVVTDANGCTRTFTVFIFEKEICGDGIDNDGDGLTDCDDPECAPAQPAGIAPSNPAPCVDQLVFYTAIPPTGVEYDSYIWTAPPNADVVDENGVPMDIEDVTGATLYVFWRTTAGGQICVRGVFEWSPTVKCFSPAFCITVSVNDVPIQPGDIILNNN